MLQQVTNCTGSGPVAGKASVGEVDVPVGEFSFRDYHSGQHQRKSPPPFP